MSSKSSANIPGMASLLCALFTSLFFPIFAQAAIDKTSSIEASGEGSIYDLKATADGTLRVCTKARRSADRWRATIAQVTTAGGASAVGTGSTAAFTGCVSRPIVSGAQYVVLITWERPVLSTFPASVTVRFTGPTDATDPPVTGVNGATLSAIVPRPTSFTEVAQGCPVDGSTISCGALVNCSFDSVSDLDTFRFSALANSVASIKICGPLNSVWEVFGPAGNRVTGAFGLAQASLPASGTYTVQTQEVQHALGTYSLSLEGVSQTYQCGLLIAFNQTRSGSLDSCADTDTFQFRCQPGQVISVSVAGPLNTAWELFGPAGNRIAGSFGVSTAACTTAGTHVIRVSNSMGGTGAYSLTLQKITGP